MNRFRFFVMLTTLASSKAVSAQRLGGAASADVSLVRVFLALLFCLILAILAVFIIRQRYGGRLPSFFGRMASTNSRIRLVESRRIGPQADLCLVDCDGQEYLLLLSPGGPLLLKERPISSPEAQ